MTSVAPIYAHPKVTREPLRIAGAGSTLTVVGHRDDWIEVRFDDREFGPRSGWVHRSRVALYEEMTVTATRGGANNLAVVTSLAPIYLGPKVTPEPLRVVAAGSTLTVVRHGGEWTEVAFKDQQLGERYGWIQRSDIRIGDTTPSRASVQETVATPPRTSLPPARNVATVAVPPVVPYPSSPSSTSKPSSAPPVPPYLIPVLAGRSVPLTPVPPYMIPPLWNTTTPSYAPPAAVPYMTTPPLSTNTFTQPSGSVVSPAPLYTPSPAPPYTIPPAVGASLSGYGHTPVPGPTTSGHNPVYLPGVSQSGYARPPSGSYTVPPLSTASGYDHPPAVDARTASGYDNLFVPGTGSSYGPRSPLLWALPASPGTTTYSTPGVVIIGDMAYPTLPGTNIRDYSKPGWRIR